MIEPRSSVKFRWLARRITTPTLLALALLGWFGVILGCAIAAGKLIGLAERPDGSTGVDSSITTWVVAHRSGALTTAARALSTLGSQTVLLPLVALVTAVLLSRRRFVAAGMLIAAWAGAIGLYNLTKQLVDRMRPPTDIWLTDVGRSSSFPSGHATQSLATFVALAVVVAASLRLPSGPGRALALALAVGVGWSRVYLGVHWATDVGAGWLIAAAWITGVALLAGPGKLIEQRLGRPPPRGELPRGA